MSSVNIYLTFTDNCEEVFNFYKSIFGGEFETLQRFGEMPPDPNFEIPEDVANRILHVTLRIDENTIIMGSDSMQGFGDDVKMGNNFSIAAEVDSTDRADEVFAQLSAGGDVGMPMQQQFWGS